MRQTVNVQEKGAKIYKENAILIGTFLGGPLVAGYFMSENYKVLGAHEKAKHTKAFSRIVTIFSIALIYSVPYTMSMPDVLIPMLYTVLAAYFFNRFQRNDVKAHVEDGGGIFGGWHIITVGLIGLLIMILAIALICLSINLYNNY